VDKIWLEYGNLLQNEHVLNRLKNKNWFKRK